MGNPLSRKKNVDYRHGVGAGQRIRELRNDKGLTQEALAVKVGKDRTTISDLENGRTRLTLPLQRAICDLFAVCEEWLLTGEGPKEDYKRRELEHPEIRAITESLIADPIMREAIYKGLHGTRQQRAALLGFKDALIDREPFNPFRVLEAVGVPFGVFKHLSPEDIIKTADMSNVRRMVEDAARSDMNLLVYGGEGIGKTTIFDELRRESHEGIKTAAMISPPPSMGLSMFIKTILPEEHMRKGNLDRLVQTAKAYLESIFPLNFVLFVNDGDDISESVLEGLLHLENQLLPNKLSIVIFASVPRYLGSPRRPALQYRMEGPSAQEALEYVTRVAAKSGGRLPGDVPPEIFDSCKTFNDVRDEYLRYVWEKRK